MIISVFKRKTIVSSSLEILNLKFRFLKPCYHLFDNWTIRQNVWNVRIKNFKKTLHPHTLAYRVHTSFGQKPGFLIPEGWNIGRKETVTGF
jgi:hypothetical protein